MIGLSSNVLIQFPTDLIERCTEAAPSFISHETIVETVWVLKRAHKHGKGAISEALFGPLAAKEIQVEAFNDVATALETYRVGAADFTDPKVVAATRSTGCATLNTIDERAAHQWGVISEG